MSLRRLIRTKKGKYILNLYEELTNDLENYKNEIYHEWRQNILSRCLKYLQNSLFIREEEENNLVLNFHYEVIQKTLVFCSVIIKVINKFLTKL